MDKENAANRLEEIKQIIERLLSEAGGILSEIEQREHPYSFGAYSTASSSWIYSIRGALWRESGYFQDCNYTMEDTIDEIRGKD